MGQLSLAGWWWHPTWGVVLVLTGVAVVLACVAYAARRTRTAAGLAAAVVPLLALGYYTFSPLAPRPEEQVASAVDRISTVASRLGAIVLSYRDGGAAPACHGQPRRAVLATLDLAATTLPVGQAQQRLGSIGFARVNDEKVLPDYVLLGEVDGSPVRVRGEPGRPVTVLADPPCFAS